jgi:hypothetical protein
MRGVFSGRSKSALWRKLPKRRDEGSVPPEFDIFSG